jgi:hypothetical protein
MTMDVLDIIYKVKKYFITCFRSYMQGGILERPGIPYNINERQRWPLANAIIHKKANKRCSTVAD